ncbi:MAG: OmpH family outer membrane protein, partial [Candidatus Omnitrophica bacterium]|nr:OmpH family outer membrane protein [Candidatus Omnitrophota bacterium]
IKESESRLALLKEDQRVSLEDSIDMLKGEAQEFVRQEQTNLTKDRNEKIREILLEIEKVVSDFAVKEGYEVILNDRVLIYGDPAQDLTEDILIILNKQ